MPRLAIGEIARRVVDIAQRIHRLSEDFSINLTNTSAVQKLLIDNPIRAFVDARGMGGVPYFTFDNQTFAFAFEINGLEIFSALLREVLDWRLAEYLSRGQVAAAIYRVLRNSGGQPILFALSNKTRESLPRGNLEIQVEGRPMEAVVAKIAVNVVRLPSMSTNELPTILRSWFGDEVGLPGRSDRVRFRRDANTIVMEPLKPNAQTASLPKVWERYLREAIPPGFGLTFNPANWNSGFVVSPPHIFLLVTLAKEDMNPDHQYSDHFLSDQEFNWQSQNRTAQKSKHGQMLHNHLNMGTHVHLFVRPTKKTGQKPTPFTYCGEVEFVSWEGNNPVTIRWRLKERMPPQLRTLLRVPG